MIVCCGEALIDMLPGKTSDNNDVFLPVPGGAIFNTAIALGRLDEPVGFLSSISQDMFGEQLIEYLQSSNVKTNFCVRSSQLTTLAFVKLIKGQAQYSFFDENSAGRNLTSTQLPNLSKTIEALHFGAISLIPEPCGSAYESLMASQKDKVLSLDPNIRAGFIKNETQHRARIERMIAMADIVKVSDEDLQWITNGEVFEDKIKSWLKGATQVVLLTKGADGVTAFTRHCSVYQSAFKVEVVDTIGAGDTFNAGFLKGLRKEGLLSKDKLKNLTPEKLVPALKLATKVAALTVSKAGANPPWNSELNIKRSP